jgi:hypothetical protein
MTTVASTSSRRLQAETEGRETPDGTGTRPAPQKTLPCDPTHGRQRGPDEKVTRRSIPIVRRQESQPLDASSDEGARRPDTVKRLLERLLRSHDMMLERNERLERGGRSRREIGSDAESGRKARRWTRRRQTDQKISGASVLLCFRRGFCALEVDDDDEDELDDADRPSDRRRHDKHRSSNSVARYRRATGC